MGVAPEGVRRTLAMGAREALVEEADEISASVPRGVLAAPEVSRHESGGRVPLVAVVGEEPHRDGLEIGQDRPVLARATDSRKGDCRREVAGKPGAQPPRRKELPEHDPHRVPIARIMLRRRSRCRWWLAAGSLPERAGQSAPPCALEPTRPARQPVALARTRCRGGSPPGLIFGVTRMSARALGDQNPAGRRTPDAPAERRTRGDHWHRMARDHAARDRLGVAHRLDGDRRVGGLAPLRRAEGAAVVNQRAIDLSVVMRGQLAWVGPGTCSLSASELASWLFIRIGMTDDDALRALAVDMGLTQARTTRRGRIWWREVESRADGLVVVAAGPHQTGEPPTEGP